MTLTLLNWYTITTVLALNPRIYRSLFLSVLNKMPIRISPLPRWSPVSPVAFGKDSNRNMKIERRTPRSVLIGSAMTVHRWQLYPNIYNVLEAVQMARQLVNFLMSETS